MTLRTVMVGNRDLAAKYLGEAKRVLWHLKAILSPANIPQGQLIRHYPDGTAIIVRKIFSLDMINILSPFLKEGEVTERKQDIFIFIFFDESTYKIYAMDFQPAGLVLPATLELTDETVVSKNFPLGHTWYPYYNNISKDPTPQVIPNLGNDFHYISTAIEPLFYPSKNAYDDWHYHSIQFFFDWDWDDYLPAPPVIQPVLNKTHTSVSPYTAASSFYFRMGGVLQLYREFCPEKSLVPIINNLSVVVETEVPNTGIGYFGPRGYTVDISYLGNDYASSWQERVYASGDNPPVIPQTGGSDDYLGYWFFPWTPYLHEISNFHILERGTLGSIDYVHPIISMPRIFSLIYLDGTGLHVTGNFLTEEAEYTDSLCHILISYSEVLDPANSFGFGGPFTDGVEYSYTYTVRETHERGGASASGTYFSPIGSLGMKKILNIRNDFDITITRKDRQHNVDFQKTSTLGYAYYILGNEPGFSLSDGVYYDDTNGTSTITDAEERELSIRQRFFVADEAIEDETSVLTYNYDETNQIDEDVAWVEEWWHPPEFPAPGYFPRLKYRTFSAHSVTYASTFLGTTDRKVICFEVLAYDSRMNAKVGTEYKDLIIVIYKKITVSQIQSSQTVHTRIYTAGGDLLPWTAGGINTLDETVDTYSTAGTRKVEFFLYYKIGTATGTKVKLAEFNSTVNVANGILTQTGSGQRIWGVSCQVNPLAMVYHYQLENFISSGLGSDYDSPLNFEDISYEGNTRIWESSKNVIGAICVDMADMTTGEHAQALLDPISIPYIFSVGLHIDPEEETEYEE